MYLIVTLLYRIKEKEKYNLLNFYICDIGL